MDGRIPSGRQLLRAGPPGARRPVQPGRQQRLQRRAPAQLQQRRARAWPSASRASRATAPRTAAASTTCAATTSAACASTRSAAPPTAAPASTRAQVGGVWDALLGEGRNWWFFASSDWHNRGSFGPDDRRSTKTSGPASTSATTRWCATATDEAVSPQTIVDGLRSGNNWVDSGQLIDRLAFVACAVPTAAERTAVRERWRGRRRGAGARRRAAATPTSTCAGCATMGEKLEVRPAPTSSSRSSVRDPTGKSYSPYTLPQPVAAAGRHHPAAERAGARPRRRDPRPGHRLQDAGRGRLRRRLAATTGSTWPTRSSCAAGQRAGRGQERRRAAVIKTFNGAHLGDVAAPRPRVQDDDLPHPRRCTASQYVRLRGTNLPPAVPFETDAARQPAVRPVDQRRRDPGQDQQRDRVPDELDAAHPVHDGRQQRARQRRAVHRRRRPDRRLPEPPAGGQRPAHGRPSTSRPGPTCGSTATRSSSRSRARRWWPASSRASAMPRRE